MCVLFMSVCRGPSVDVVVDLLDVTALFVPINHQCQDTDNKVDMETNYNLASVSVSNLYPKVELVLSCKCESEKC